MIYNLTNILELDIIKVLDSNICILIFSLPILFIGAEKTYAESASIKCGVSSVKYFTNLKKKRVLEIDNATWGSGGLPISYDIKSASVGWYFGHIATFKEDIIYKASCCEFRQDVSAKWIKDGKRDYGDGLSGYSYVNEFFRLNLKHWPRFIEDTGGAYGHRSKITENNNWQGYTSNSYYMKDEPGTGGAKKNHNITFNFRQKIIDTCNSGKVISSKELFLNDKWDNISAETATAIRDLDD